MCETPIQAIDSIEIDASPEDVWRVLSDVPKYPAWWPRFLGLRLLSAGPGPVGCELEVRPFGGRPFRCRVEEVRGLESIRMQYFGGFIEGLGEWTIKAGDHRTRVTYRLDVLARGRFVRFIGKWISLAGIHSRAMEKVLQNLAEVLRAPRR